MSNQLVYNKNYFTELDEKHILDTNGGGLVSAFLIGAGTAIVVNEIVERKTGASILTHAGNGLKKAGDFMSRVGDQLCD